MCQPVHKNHEEAQPDQACETLEQQAHRLLILFKQGGIPLYVACSMVLGIPLSEMTMEEKRVERLLNAANRKMDHIPWKVRKKRL